MVDCSKYVCDVHFLLIWLLLRKDYNTNNLIKVWHWIDQIIFVHSLSKFLPSRSPYSILLFVQCYQRRIVVVTVCQLCKTTLCRLQNHNVQQRRPRRMVEWNNDHHDFLQKSHPTTTRVIQVVVPPLEQKNGPWCTPRVVRRHQRQILPPALQQDLQTTSSYGQRHSFRLRRLHFVHT